MPTTVLELFQHYGLTPQGPVPWGESIPENSHGVYVVSLSDDANSNTDDCLTMAPIDIDIVKKWIDDVGTLRLDGKRPKAKELKKRLSQFWFPDEIVLYIGKTDVPLKNRVRDYYDTPLGARSPHSGGHWIKTLEILYRLYVYWSPTTQPENMEKSMLGYFVNNVSDKSKANLADPSLPIPFANLEFPKGNRKKHGIKGSRNPRRRLAE